MASTNCVYDVSSTLSIHIIPTAASAVPTAAHAVPTVLHAVPTVLHAVPTAAHAVPTAIPFTRLVPHQTLNL